LLLTRSLLLPNRTLLLLSRPLFLPNRSLLLLSRSLLLHNRNLLRLSRSLYKRVDRRTSSSPYPSLRSPFLLCRSLLLQTVSFAPHVLKPLALS
jgi:hypothetical protein